MWTLYLLGLLGGMLAGIINTLAGSGSLVTLPLLAMLGLPAPIANATNRVGVVVQCLVGSYAFHREGMLNAGPITWWYVGPTLLGSVLGALVAVDLNEQVMNVVIGVIMVAMLVMTLLDTKRFVRPPQETEEAPIQRPSWRMLLLLFAVGIYGGFIQAGVGVILLVVLVTGAGLDVGRANAMKMLIALGLAAAALVLFVWNDMIDWPLGLLMAAGQATGAWLGVKFLAGRPGAARWVQRLLIVVIVLGIVRFLGPVLRPILSS